MPVFPLPTTKVTIGTLKQHPNRAIFVANSRLLQLNALKNVVTMSINQIAKRDGITTKEAYKKYGISVFRTTNAQSSIRTRIIDYKKEKEIDCQYLSIEYVPKTGKNRGKVYEQFYKDDICNLFVWLRDTSEVIDGELYKKDLQGT